MAERYKQQVGARIRRRRDELGLTQKDLADRAHYKEAQSVSRWERGETLPIRNLDIVAEALEWTLAELVDGVVPPNATVARQLGMEPPKADGPTPDVLGDLGTAKLVLQKLAALQERIDANTQRLSAIEAQLASEELTDHDRKMLSRFEEMLDRRAADTASKQSRSRVAQPHRLAGGHEAA